MIRYLCIIESRLSRTYTVRVEEAVKINYYISQKLHRTRRRKIKRNVEQNSQPKKRKKLSLSLFRKKGTKHISNKFYEHIIAREEAIED